MAAVSNPLRIRNKSGRDIDILCTGGPSSSITTTATTSNGLASSPVSPRTLPSPAAIRLPERRRPGPFAPYQPIDLSLPLRQRSPAPQHHRSPIQLPPLGIDNHRSSAPEMGRRKSHWELSSTRDESTTVVEYAHDPFSAPDNRGPLSSSSLGATAREYYHQMGEDRRHSYHDGMHRRHARQASPPTPQLFRCGSRDSINTVDPASPSTPRDALPEYGYPATRNASFSSMGGHAGAGSMYPDPTQFEQPGARHFDGYAKPPQAPMPRFPGTLPAPHGVQMHAHHYHEQHYHDAYAASQGHMLPQIPAFAPPPATTVTASGTKRYHCRYADAVGCEKTFTTSGHASRHSKIHTCEKGIQCAFAGCPKKFTRADNMKQHLETHFKDSRRPRPSPSSSAAGPNRRALRKNASAAAVAGEAESGGGEVVAGARREGDSVGGGRDNEGLDALAAAVAAHEDSDEGTPGPGRV
ncbi:transcriptional repressor [Pseudogymnoascus australis]